MQCATAKTFEGTHEILSDMMLRNGGTMEWEKEHNSRFELTKLALIDFLHCNVKTDRPPTLESVTSQ